VNALRTVRDLLSLPTRPLLCETCGGWARWITPRQRITKALTGRVPCICGGSLRAVSEVRLP
jgi:hypothetical protein